ERLGDRTMTAWAQHMLGGALIRLYRVDEAAEPIRRALRTFHDAGDVAGIALVLDDHAAEAVVRGDLPRAARLYGAARALSSASGVGLADFIDKRWEREGRPNAAAAMDPATLDRYAAEGRAMSLDEAVAYALEMPVETLPGPHDHAGGRPA
ncbi:MAG TPA: hypothetical protein VFO78_05910, partial [Candidatus Limnocylindrales bacterium]|nr:hypothetical protein [Candidatus Limnocylindrales bacterium]